MLESALLNMIVNLPYFTILEQLQWELLKKGYQISFYNSEHYFGIHKQCFFSNSKCQNWVPF